MAKKEEKRDYPPLHRSEANKIIAGVAGGLGEYFGVDPTIVRIIFVLLTLFGGSGILIYIILCLLLPSDAHFSNPRDHIRDNMEDIKERARSFASDIHFRNHGNNRPLFGFIILILGVLFLLDNFGFYSFSLGRLWPIILILFGLSIISR